MSTTQTTRSSKSNGKKVPPLTGARAFPDAMDGTTGKTTREANDTPAAGEPENKYRAVPRPDPAVKAKLQKLSKLMDEIEDERGELNAKAALIREEVKNIGVDVATFMYSRRIAKMDEPKREVVDLSHKLVREALGMPIQTDWISVTDGADETKQ